MQDSSTQYDPSSNIRWRRFPGWLNRSPSCSLSSTDNREHQYRTLIQCTLHAVDCRWRIQTHVQCASRHLSRLVSELTLLLAALAPSRRNSRESHPSQGSLTCFVDRVAAMFLDKYCPPYLLSSAAAPPAPSTESYTSLEQLLHTNQEEWYKFLQTTPLTRAWHQLEYLQFEHLRQFCIPL